MFEENLESMFTFLSSIIGVSKRRTRKGGQGMSRIKRRKCLVKYRIHLTRKVELALVRGSSLNDGGREPRRARLQDVVHFGKIIGLQGSIFQRHLWDLGGLWTCPHL